MTAGEPLAGDTAAADGALASFATERGETVQAAANKPMLLHDAKSVWFVARGALDVFCTERHEGRVVAAAKHLLRAEAGRLVFGLPDLDVPLTVIAKGLVDTQLLRLDASLLSSPQARNEQAPAVAHDEGFAASATGDSLRAEVARQAQAWVNDMALAVSADIDYRPHVTCLVNASENLASGSQAAAASEPAAPGEIDAVSAGTAAGDSIAMSTDPLHSGLGAGARPGDGEDGFVDDGENPFAGGTAPRVRLLSVADGVVVGVRGVETAWIAAAPGADAATLWYLGTEALPQSVEGSPRWMPLTAQSWVTVTASTTSGGEDLARGSADDAAAGDRGLSILVVESVHDGELFAALADFHTSALRAEALNRRLRLADEANAQTALATHRRMADERARALLGSLTAAGAAVEDQAVSHQTPLMAALQRIGRHSGIEFREPQLAATAPPATLEQVIEASGLRARQIRLTHEDRWWRSDSGAMLAYRRAGADPVALLPAFGGYRAVGADGRAERVTAKTADDYSPQAWTIYPKLPDDRQATARDLLRLSRCGAGADLARFVVAGLLAALIAQGPAVALGMLSDWALPFARGEALAQILVALALLGAAAAVLTVFGAMSLLRLEARAGSRLSAAAWDRLLALPLPFFRDTVAGELAVRMGTFQQLRDLLSGVVANVFGSVIFLLPTLGVLFFYDAVLAATAVAMSLAALAVVVVLGISQIPHQRLWHSAVRDLWGRLFQFIGGIAKIRASGAETAAFASSAGAYRDKQVAEIRRSRIGEHLAAFGSAYPFVFAAVLCAVTIARGDAVAVGDFVVALTASFVLYAAVADLGFAVDALAEAFTAYEQMTPILEAVPERDASASIAPVALEGELAVEQVSFRYLPDGPPVLDDVTLTARAGEFVAVVGGSGAGKSTLVRLMLGLDTPERGAVFFDGRDLRNLDRRAVRRQIGVVPQDSSLQPGSLVENIIGMSEDLTLDDAWRAARLAAVDRDITEMPMQMMTMVADRAGVFSGGQIQRIRIAAALARRPSIVILDEATSWLDSRSQAEVMESIEGLGITRVVVAHRLSTIRRADRVYVLEAGRVVQVGGYEELLQAPGRFRELVSRQLL
ncbi:MAG: ATP-binding cassette domain-containing protein [Acidimicrobiaceae bacterium]|nr:ATP-binding cassette domain-containing protein [Acidimicrobiaceae bacterium]